MRSPRRSAFSFLLVLVLMPAASAQAPPGYYDTVDATNSAALRQSLHAVIDDHKRFPYTSGATDTWDILELAQQDPADSGRILDVYRNASYAKIGGGNNDYNREHSWPISFGFPNDGASNYPFTDCHAVFLCDSVYNNSRGNRPFKFGSSSHSERTTHFNDGQGGGSGVYPGNSNWTSSVGLLGSWEVWNGRRGDIARALLYLDIRYEGGTHGITGAVEPDLVLTDDESLIQSSNTGTNGTLAYMGLRSVLLAWHAADPVDDFERARHEVVYAFQGNRNPFIDYPAWVDCLFNDVCSTTVGTPFCFGDGSATPCPCGNVGATLHGCANGSSASGAALVGTGSPSIAANDCVLEVVASVPNQPGLFFQGLNAVAGGFGVVFGDGLRCAGGGVARLQVRLASGAGSAVTTVDLVAAGQAQAGETFRYQWWYRDPAGSPCGTNFNLSNGLQLTWLP